MSMFAADAVSKIAELVRHRLARKNSGPQTDWERKQAAVHPSRFYGDGGTVHDTGHLDVEMSGGQVVAVWFRCQMLPFRVSPLDREQVPLRFPNLPGLPRITGVVVHDAEA